MSGVRATVRGESISGVWFMNPAECERIFQRVNRAVWILTAADGNRRGGLAASWVMPASLDLECPLVCISIGRAHYTAELIDQSGAWAAHLLGPEQFELAWNFCCDSGRERDKLAVVRTQRGVTGSPLLTDALAYVECRAVDHYDLGDRRCYWGRVVAAESCREGEPLCEREFFAQASDEQRQTLLANRQFDIEQGQALVADWRRRHGV